MVPRILEALKLSDADPSIPFAAPEILSGFSGRKLIGSLQRLTGLFADDPTACYLEIGVFQGLTLLSVAAANPDVPCFGIDNFAYFDPDKQNYNKVLDRSTRLGTTNAHLINMDYEDALATLAQHLCGRKAAVYFVDGPHDYRSQLMCLELVLPMLHPEAVIVVDDSNYRHVRQANRDFLITHPEFKLAFEAYTSCHPSNMTAEQRAIAEEGWWNGVNVIVSDTGNALPEIYPPTERSRQLYENEHTVHAHRLAHHAPELLALARMIQVTPWFRLPLRALRTLRNIRGMDASRGAQHPALNTYSEALPTSRISALRGRP